MIDELNALDARYGPLGSVVIHERDGRQMSAFGVTPEDALDTLRTRRSGPSSDLVDRDRYRVIKQRDMRSHLHRLG